MLFERGFDLTGLVSCQKPEHHSRASNILFSLQDEPLSMARFWKCIPLYREMILVLSWEKFKPVMSTDMIRFYSSKCNFIKSF